jgi:hypothetical protein
MVRTVALSVVTALGALGCTGLRVQDPRDATAAFLQASSRGDADAIARMLSQEGRALSAEDVRRIVQDERAELAQQAAALASPQARVMTRARLRFDDGEEASLEWSDGRFSVESGGTLPGGSSTPIGALEDLRRALARRSYAALLRVLSPETRRAIEQDLRTLVGGLARPDTLPLQTTGDTSSAVLPGGHRVSLKRESGVWKVEDFD